MSCFEIDVDAVQDTQEVLSEKDFKRFEKALWLLFSIANHDTTTHAYWVIAEWWRRDYLNDLLGLNLWFQYKSDSLNIDSWEIAAAAFHRDMFEEIDELWVERLPLRRTILNNAVIVLEYISRLKNNSLRKYWETILKYPLFSLINPESKDVQQLRSKYPAIELKSTRWGQIIHRNENHCSVSPRIEQTITVSLREIREVMMNCYRTWAEAGDTLADSFAEKWGYPQPQDLDDLERMMRARKFWLPLETDEETLEIYEAHQRLTNRNPFTESWDLLWDYKQYLAIKEHWLDTSAWDDREKWKTLFVNIIREKIKEYKRTGRKIEEVEKISIYISRLRDDYNFDIDENNFPEFLEARKERLRMILRWVVKKRWESDYYSYITINNEYIFLKEKWYTDDEIDELFEKYKIKVDEEAEEFFKKANIIY